MREREVPSCDKPAEHHRHLHLIVGPKGHVGVPDEVLSEVLGTDVFEP